MTIKKLTYFALAVTIASGIGHASAAPGPMEEVRTTVETVLTILQEQGLDKALRRQRLSAVIRKRFDFVAMSQRTLGNSWGQASPMQRELFVASFADLLEATYIGRIEAYSDEEVKYVGEKRREGYAAVDTLIVTQSTELPIRYKMLYKDDEWRVYDVVIEDVSLIRNYHSSYGEIIREEGIEGLLTRMQEKTHDLREAPSSTPAP